MPIKKVRSKRFKSGYGFKLTINRTNMRRISRTFESEKKAREVEAAMSNLAISEELSIPLVAKVKLKDLVAEHLEAIQKRPRFPAHKIVIGRFCALVGGERSVQSLKKADLMLYVKARQKDGLANQTINREMTEIKSMLNSAWKHYAELDEYRAPKISRLPEPVDGRRETWTDEETAAILATLRADALPFEEPQVIEQRSKLAEMLVLQLTTGMRAGEARKLHRSQVDFRKRVVNIVSLKGGKPRKREVPINDEALEILTRRAALGEWIFSNPKGDRHMTEPYKLLRTAAKRAGVAYGIGVGKIANDARRTFENQALEAGHSPRAVAEVLGHSVNTMVKNYLRATEEQKRNIVESRQKQVSILVVKPVKTGITDTSDKREKSAKNQEKPANDDRSER
jgi:integrase